MHQFILLALGLVGSLYSTRQIAHRSYLTPPATLYPNPLHRLDELWGRDIEIFTSAGRLGRDRQELAPSIPTEEGGRSDRLAFFKLNALCQIDLSLCLKGWKGGWHLQGDPDDVTRPDVPAGIDSQRGSQPQRPPR